MYRILDEVLTTGVPVDIVRNGHTLRISAVGRPARSELLAHRPDVIVGDPNDLVHLDWTSEWRP